MAESNENGAESVGRMIRSGDEREERKNETNDKDCRSYVRCSERCVKISLFHVFFCM